MKLKGLAFLILIFAFLPFITEPVYAFSNPFKKKYDKEEEIKIPMVQTVQEWMEEAENVKMDLRTREETQAESDYEKYLPPKELPVVLKRYNTTAGRREIDLTRIFETKNVRSMFVSDPDFNNAVYSEVYYYPQTRQTASSVYLIELDGHLSNKEKLHDLSIFEHTRYPLISTALPYLKEGFFSTLTVVDFSSDGKKVLIKERRGSNRFGLYETYVWIYFITDENRENNECYMNNVNFANEMKDKEQFLGQNNPDKKEKSPFDTETKNKANYKLNMDNLNDAPNIQNVKNANSAHADNSSFIGLNSKKKEDENNKEEKIEFLKTTNYNGEINPQNTGWIRPGVVNFKMANSFLNTYSVSSPDKNLVQKDKGTLPISYLQSDLNYNNIKSFIKESWKNEILTSSNKTRWYNTAPNDFRVDDTYRDEKKNIGYSVRLNLLNEMIKAYWFDRKNLILNYIRWDLNPLGFNSKNKDEIVVAAWAYTKDKKEVSLGLWGVDVKTGIPRLIPEGENISIEANGFCLEEKLSH